MKTKLYICDPYINTTCEKSACCHMRKGDCFLTCYEEQAAIKIPINDNYAFPKGFKYIAKLIVWTRHIWLSFLYGRKM